MHKLIDEGGDYSEMKSAEYGFDAYDNPVVPDEGYELVPFTEELQQGDAPFDVYSGWLDDSFYNSSYHHSARPNGRWTAWQRRKMN